MEFVRTEVDGVPAFWAPAEGDRLKAGLVFRVGRSDETLTTGGITHLTEHLALDGIEVGERHVNGQTGPVTTSFLTSGDEDEVAGFLAAVCRGLRELPADWLARERTVLRTEAASRARAVVEPLLPWRYGPATFGLPAYGEFGLEQVTAGDVERWSGRWFTRGNAALWLLGGPPPAGLRLDLPGGERMPTAEASSALPRTPAFFNSPVDGAVFDAVVPRGTAATVYAALLKRRLWAVLRREQGISYTVDAGYQRRDGPAGVVTAVVDALPDQHAAVVGAFVDVLTGMVTAPPATDEVRKVVTGLDAASTDVARAGSGAVGAAFDVLVGAPVRSVEELRSRRDAVTVDDVRSVAEQVLDGALLMVPEGQRVGRAGFVAAPATSDGAVEGRAYEPLRSTGSHRLIVGVDGVSLRVGRRVATVRYAECAGMLAWPDGARTLYGPDGIMVTIEPQLWHGGAMAAGAVNAAVPPDRVAPMPARAPGTVPRPPATEPDPAPAAPAPPPEPVRRVNWLRLALPVGALLAMFLVAMFGPPTLALLFGAFAVMSLGFAVRNPRR